jgi:hypothetical protein
MTCCIVLDACLMHGDSALNKIVLDSLQQSFGTAWQATCALHACICNPRAGLPGSSGRIAGCASVFAAKLTQYHTIMQGRLSMCPGRTTSTAVLAERVACPWFHNGMLQLTCRPK